MSTSTSTSLPLSIHLDETRFAIPADQDLLVTGHLKATLAGPFGSDHQLGLIGRLRSRQNRTVRIMYSDLVRVDGLDSHRDPQDDCYHTPFVFRIHHPRTLPPTIHHSHVTIDYGVHYFKGPHLSTKEDKCILSAPLELYTGRININKHHPSTKLYWGTTGAGWRYEIEVPRIIDLEQSSSVFGDPAISVRLRSGWRHAVLRRHAAAADAVELDACLIGCRLEETLWLDRTSKTSRPVKETAIVTTHVLAPPSVSWTAPCRILISNDHDSGLLPTLSLSDQHTLEISHHLWISLVFSASPDSLNLRVPVTVIPSGHRPAMARPLSPIVIPSRRLSSSSSTTDDDDYDNKSRDSGVCLSC